METAKEQLAQRLIAAIRDLPEERVLTVLHFAEYLQSSADTQLPERGSAGVILHALDEVGPLQFEPRELGILLEDIEHAREVDLQERG